VAAIPAGKGVEEESSILTERREPMAMSVAGVIVGCETTECDYRLVELTNGQFAFVWGNISAHVGDTLPQEHIDAPTGEKGIEVFDSYDGAEKSYRRRAEELPKTVSISRDEMLALLPHDVP
jgi:hypothetical protein